MRRDRKLGVERHTVTFIITDLARSQSTRGPPKCVMGEAVSFQLFGVFFSTLFGVPLVRVSLFR